MYVKVGTQKVEEPKVVVPINTLSCVVINNAKPLFFFLFAITRKKTLIYIAPQI